MRDTSQMIHAQNENNSFKYIFKIVDQAFQFLTDIIVLKQLQGMSG